MNILIRHCLTWPSYPPRAARVAALLRSELGVDVETAGGGEGEFTVHVGDKVVAQKGLLGFPSDKKVLQSVRAAING